MKSIACIFFCFAVISSCQNDNKKIVDSSSEIVNDFSTPDTIVKHYEQIINEYYLNTEENAYNVELEIVGKIEFEDDSILIISFNEILKFGSWHYTNSSLFFFKNGDSLIPVYPDMTEGLLDDDFYETGIQYPNRIHGTFVQRIDLTGDSKPEYIFHSTGSIRTGFEEKYNIYQLNVENQMLEITNLSISSTGFQGECDSTYGELSEFRIIENDTLSPIIEVKAVVSICDNNKVKIESLTYRNYRWNEGQTKFQILSLTKNKHH